MTNVSFQIRDSSFLYLLIFLEQSTLVSYKLLKKRISTYLADGNTKKGIFK